MVAVSRTGTRILKRMEFSLKEVMERKELMKEALLLGVL